MLSPCALECGQLHVGTLDPELLGALIPDARLVGIGLDAVRADLVDRFLVVGGREHQRRLPAAGLGRAAEIGPGAGEIADIDHLLAMRNEILDAVALVRAKDQRRFGSLRNVEPGRGAGQDRAVRSHQLDAKIGRAGSRFRQPELEIADLIRRHIPLRGAIGPALREGDPFRYRPDGDHAACRQRLG